MHQTPLKPLSDTALHHLLRQSPDEGLTCLLEEHGDTLRGAMRREGVRPGTTEADEIEADVLIVVWQRIDSFDLSRSPLDAWLCGIVHTLARQHRRERRERYCERIEDHHTSAIEPTEVNSSSMEASQRLRRVILHMPHRQATLLEMDLASPSGRADTGELQAILGGSRDAVYSLRRRAQAGLRHHHRKLGL